MVVITSANVHDNQLAIPMEKLTKQKVISCYSFMDSRYNAKIIDDFICSRERIPIIDLNNHNNKNRVLLDPVKQERYKIRTVIERSNFHIKDNLMQKALYVKSYTKVSFVLMTSVFGLGAIKY